MSDKKYKIILQRVSEHKDVKKPNVEKIEDSTIGELSVCEVGEAGIMKKIWGCYTCENIGPSTDTPKQDKRIVARKYKLEWTDSGKNASLAKAHPEYKHKIQGRNVAILVTCDDELKSFRDRRILIHVGNYPQDTEGCLLIGKSLGEKPGTIAKSIVACKEFFDLMKKIGINNCDLEVKEIKN